MERTVCGQVRSYGRSSAVPSSRSGKSEDSILFETNRVLAAAGEHGSQAADPPQEAVNFGKRGLSSGREPEIQG
jgi:hypothetical protein